MSANISSLRRFCHWGPIIAMSIIKCITFMTVYMNSMWWPPNSSIYAFINQLVFLLLSTLAAFNYIMATITGPGYLKPGWRPMDSKDIKHLQFCKICQGYKAPRAHHCRKCDRCVKKMDHHCPWINSCVGWANHAYFTYFLAFSIAGSFHGAIILIASFYCGIHRLWYINRGLAHLATVQFTLSSLILCILSFGLAIGVVIALGMLLYFQLKAISSNRTEIEDWIVEKAKYRRQHISDQEPFIYPYDLGRSKNFQQVLNFSCTPMGDGIHWKIVKGCDQYTLTREQMAQKIDKRARTKQFKIIRPFTGRYLPLFTQGFRICIAAPCTNEPRILLIPDDVIKVTRFRKHWLYGERIVNEKNGALKRKGAIRGWFPRRCAVELIEPNEKNNCNNGHLTNNHKKNNKKGN